MVKDLDSTTQAFIDEDVYARTTLLKVSDLESGVGVAIEPLDSVFFRPNILFLSLFANERQIDLEKLLNEIAPYKIGVALLARHPVVDLGREQGSDWKLGMRLSNLDLSVLLAYQLARNW